MNCNQDIFDLFGQSLLTWQWKTLIQVVVFQSFCPPLSACVSISPIDFVSGLASLLFWGNFQPSGILLERQVLNWFREPSNLFDSRIIKTIHFLFNIHLSCYRPNLSWWQWICVIYVCLTRYLSHSLYSFHVISSAQSLEIGCAYRRLLRTDLFQFISRFMQIPL